MFRWVVFVVAFLVVSLTTVGSARPDDRHAALLFQAATAKEVVEGDLKGAIVMYQRAVDEAGSNRPMAAKALLALAVSYQRIGAGEARAVFARIVRDFSDQKEMAATARARLLALGSARNQTVGLSTRRIFSDDSFVMTGISTDGHLAVGYRIGGAPGRAMLPDLLVRDTTTGRATRVVMGSDAGYGSNPVLSRDGRQLAFFWAEGMNPDGSIASPSLRVIGTEPGAKPRTLVSGGWFVPLAWSTDGSALLAKVPSDERSAGAHAPTQIAWIAVSDGTVRTIRRFTADQDARGATLSPDGAFIAYSAAARPGSADRHILMMDAQGQGDVEVVKMAGINTDPIWTPGGSHLLFTSDRSGTRGLWSVALAGGAPSAQPVLIQTRFTGRPVGMSDSGSLYYTESNGGGPSIFVGERVGSAMRIVQTFSGASASWSPDGKSIAFMRVDGTASLAAGKYAVIVRSVNTGEERLYPHDGMSAVSPRWLHTGKSLVVFVRPEGDGGRPGGSFYMLDLSTGAFTWMFPRAGEGHMRSGVIDVSPNDDAVYMSVKRAQNPTLPVTGIVRVNLKTGVEQPVVTFPEPGLAGMTFPAVAVSPDGSTLAIMTWADPLAEQARLIAVKTDGTGYKDIYGPFPASTVAEMVRWTADSQRLLFVTTDATTGVSRLMSVPQTGGSPRFEGLDTSDLVGTGPLPRPAPGGLGSVDISPDATRVLFGARTLETFETWMLENVLSTLGSR